MCLSKFQNNFYNIIGAYLQAIYTDPIRTKSITSCILASCGNATSQLISGGKEINWNNLRAFGLFGFIFGGTIPHYFFMILEKLVPSSSKTSALKKLIIERLIYAPFYQFFSLYMLSRLEGKSHEESYTNMEKLFWPVLKANWKFLTILQLANFAFVPGMLRVLIVNIIGFFWSIFLATKRRQSLH